MSARKFKEIPGSKLPKVYYAGRSGYALESNGRFIPLPSEGQVRAHLKIAGADSDDLPALLCRIRVENYVAHAGPVAGFPPGLHKNEDSGENFLVTTGPAIIEGVPGKNPFVEKFLRELLDDPKHPEQYVNVLCWLGQARRNLVRRQRRPLPALVLVGPINGGKSLLIDIIRRVLGGRMADALRLLDGRTQFSAECAGAELLVVDDGVASHDSRHRANFGHGIKTLLFANAIRVEGKHRDAVSLRPIQALVVAVNDESESLKVLPQLDASMTDKLTLVMCAKATLDGLSDRDEITRRIVAELPALVGQLDQHEIPAEHVNQRTGVRTWHHPRVLRLMREGDVASSLLEIIRMCPAIIGDEDGVWRGSASELQGLLVGDPKTAAVARDLLSYRQACGGLLGRLASRPDGSVRKLKFKDGVQRWGLALR